MTVDCEGDYPRARILIRTSAFERALSMAIPEHYDQEKLAEVALAVLSLAAFSDRGTFRAWKGMDWDVLDLLHEKGWIGNPVGKKKSVMLTEEGNDWSIICRERHFGKGI